MLMTITTLLNKTRLSFIAVFLLLLFIQPLIDPDYFWHLKTGEYILSHHALPAGDIFSFTRFGQPWVLHEWLFEVVLYGMFAWLGPLGVKLLTVTFAMSALGIVFVLTRRIAQSTAVASVLMFIAALPFAGGLAPRPQLITYCCFAIFLFVLLTHKYYNAGRSLLLLPFLMVIWVNAHGGYLIGIALVGLFTSSEWINYWMGHARTRQQKQRLVWLTQVVCATTLASLINPGFLAHWLYPFQVLGMAANDLIQEWQSPNFHDFGPKAYLMLVLIFILSYSFASRKPDITEVLIPAFFIVMGFLATRHIPVAVLAVVPFIALALSRGTIATISASWHRSSLASWYTKWLGSSKELGQGEFVLNWIVLAIFTTSLVAYAPTYHSNDKEKVNEVLPVNAANFVAANGITGNMFNNYGEGGYLIYRLSPALKVFIDGRADIYGDKFLTDFLDIYSGKANWKEKFDRLSIDFAIVGKDAPIRQLLLAEGSFKEVYFDQHHSVLLRNTSKFQALLSKAANQGPG
ncbi:hypothetical protein SAMN04515620_14417 [Collimonas sp. OK607]|uniref:hypothetical protein n=1 Tax=Collimonas sp. OK607 TaxID=1798194 RepID=UPI0008F03710|nr:hypothetical protein [Collimonas sp. OK607]SFB33278.1 hypothetical protein SAMN04515620_14417 [Collimonas sp. OK607]